MKPTASCQSREEGRSHFENKKAYYFVSALKTFVSVHADKPPTTSPSLTQQPDLMPLIFSVRKQRVILDAHLAELYGVTTGALNQAVKRNHERFPEDFMMQLSQAEYDNLKSQNVISSSHGGRRSRPRVFTEHGALMAANVLNSRRATAMSVAVVRAFVRLRQMVLSVDELARKVDRLERKYDAQFKVIFDAVRELMPPPPPPPRKKIGF